jgi:hypothetical protein
MVASHFNLNLSPISGDVQTQGAAGRLRRRVVSHRQSLVRASADHFGGRQRRRGKIGRIKIVLAGNADQGEDGSTADFARQKGLPERHGFAGGFPTLAVDNIPRIGSRRITQL